MVQLIPLTSYLATTTELITPSAVTEQVWSVMRSSTTVTPATRTITRTSTSTATSTSMTTTTRTQTSTTSRSGLLDPILTVIGLRARADPKAEEVELRAIVTPSYLKGLRKTDVRAACSCLNLEAPTYTARRTTRATGTRPCKFAN